MKIRKSEFLISAVKQEQYPDIDLPEIAFAGRSNVGKSSLINFLLNRKNLARTSQNPGKTQTINFFEMDEAYRFVDLPGYGYARVSKTQKATWGGIIETYLNNRENLLEVFQLIDIRHKPTAEDKQMFAWIRNAGYNGIIIATKADKLSNNKIVQQIKMIKKELDAEDCVVIPTSTLKKTGKYNVWDVINQLFELNGYEVFVERQIQE